MTKQGVGVQNIIMRHTLRSMNERLTKTESELAALRKMVDDLYKICAEQKGGLEDKENSQ